MASLRGLLASLLASRARALPWFGPAATPLVDINESVDEPKTTSAAVPHEIYRRDSYPVSLCGWIAGVGSQSAWCSSHSSCVWNTDINFVGCCDMTSDGCAFYTSCVDINSAKPTVDRNDVYTCVGTSECYLNTYPSGLVQYGCGKSEWATTVLTSYSDFNTDLSFQVVFTGTKSKAKATTTVETKYTTLTLTATSLTASTTSTALTALTYPTASTSPTAPAQASSADGSTGQTSSTATTPSVGANTNSDAPARETSSGSTANGTRIGAIAGGAVGGVAGVAILATIIFCYWRKNRTHKHNKEQQQAEAVTGAHGTIAELESPKPSPVPFQHMTAISLPTSGRYSRTSIILAPGSPAVELP